MTSERLEELVQGNTGGLLALVALKYFTAAAGVVILVLYAARRRAVRRGLLPPPPRRAPPVPLLPLLGSLGVLVAWILTMGAARAGLGLLEESGRLAKGTADSTGAGMAITGAAGLPYAIGIAWARRRRAAGLLPPLRARLSATVQVFLVGSAVTVALALVGALVLKLVFGVEPSAQTLVEEAVERPTASFLWLLAIFGVVVAPFIEESFFRALLYPAARAVGGPAIAAFAVSIAFAAIHMDANAYLPLLGLALLLAGLFEATDSLLAVTLVHALNNASSLVPILLLGRAS